MAKKKSSEFVTVTKKELVELVSERLDVPVIDVKPIVQEFLDQMVAALTAGKRIEIRDVGVWEGQTRTRKWAHNPLTQQRVQPPEIWRVKFKAGRLLRKRNGHTVGVSHKTEQP